MAVHVRYKSWYISLLSSEKQQREMNKFCVVWRTQIYLLIYSLCLFLNLYTKRNKLNHFARFMGKI